MTASSSDPGPGALSLSGLIRTALDRRPKGAGPGPVVDDARRAIPFEALIGRRWVAASRADLAGRSLLLLTRRPMGAVLALCGLDGLAARIVLCPPDLDLAHLPSVVADAAIDAIVHDDEAAALPPGVPAYAITDGVEGLGEAFAGDGRTTEWALFTSGTTGRPKMVAHSLAGLTHAIFSGKPADDPAIVWATFYDIRRYGGLQMLLRALTGGHTMLLTSPGESQNDFLARLAAAGATHVAGTPSHWRSALMNPALETLSPRYARLSGEIADQPVLDRLAKFFPNAAVGHAFASTEAGVGFEVTDGLEGFPAAYLTREGPVEMRVEDGTLRIRSPRTAHHYLGEGAEPLAGPDGFVDTGDLVEQRGDRLYFMGRASGVINVGGLKVHPEEVEAVINACPGVRVSLVKARRNPVTGAVVAAEVVLADPAQGLGDSGRATRETVLDWCRAKLSTYKVPASVKFVADLPMTAGGKLERRNA